MTWPVAELVPHAAPLLLLDELIDWSEDGLCCGLTVRADGLFDHQGKVPAAVGIEYMAQAVAAFSGLRAKRRNEPVKEGFLLGSRRFSSSVSQFDCGVKLRVSVQCQFQGTDGMGAFDCEVVGDGVSQMARLTVFEPVDDSWRSST